MALFDFFFFFFGSAFMSAALTVHKQTRFYTHECIFVLGLSSVDQFMFTETLENFVLTSH